MIVTAFILSWAALLIAPETPTGRALHRLLVTAPARQLARVTRGHVLVAAVLAIAVMAAWSVFAGEAVRLMAMALPDILAWATMIDLATLLDGALVAVTLASATRWRDLRRSVGGRSRARARARRTRVVRPNRTSANDDEVDRALAA